MSSRGNLDHHGLRWSLGKISFIFYLHSDSYPLGQILDGVNDDGTLKYTDPVTGYQDYNSSSHYKMVLATPYYNSLDNKVDFKIKYYVPSIDYVDKHKFTSSQYSQNSNKIKYYTGPFNGVPLTTYNQLSYDSIGTVRTRLYEPCFDYRSKKFKMFTQEDKLTDADIFNVSEARFYDAVNEYIYDPSVYKYDNALAVSSGLLSTGSIYEYITLVIFIDRISNESNYYIKALDNKNELLCSTMILLENLDSAAKLAGNFRICNAAFNKDMDRFAIIYDGIDPSLNPDFNYSHIVHESHVSIHNDHGSYSIVCSEINEDFYSTIVTNNTEYYDFIYIDTDENSPTFGEYGPDFVNGDVAEYTIGNNFLTDHYKPISVYYNEGNVLSVVRIRYFMESNEVERMYVGYQYGRQEFSAQSTTVTTLYMNSREIPLSSITKTIERNYHYYYYGYKTEVYTSTGTWNKLMVVNPIHDHVIYVNDVIDKNYNLLVQYTAFYPNIESFTNTKNGVATIISNLKGVETSVADFNTSYDKSDDLPLLDPYIFI